MRRLLLIGLLCFAPMTGGCAKAPPNLSPAGTAAFQKTRVIKGLDLLRDFAIDAEAQSPKVLSTDSTRKIVTYHQSALRVIQASDSGWVGATVSSLTEVTNALPPGDRQKVAPYVALVQTVLTEVTR